MTTNRYILASLTVLLALLLVACSQSEQQSQALRPQVLGIFTDSLPKPLGYVNDFERLYAPEQQAFLENLLSVFEDSTTIQIALVTIPASFTEQNNFDNYTLQLAKSWGVGQKDKNNGVLIGISSSYRQMRIQNGTGIETVLSDAETKLIVDSFFIPGFKKGDYFSGTLNGISELTRVLKERSK
jgi:uncharacterized protein